MVNNLEKNFPFRLNTVGINPCEAPTILELLHDYYNKIQEVVKQSNDTEIHGEDTRKITEQLKQETISFMEWCKSEGLPEETRKLLDMWYQDGTLEHLLNTQKLDNIKVSLENKISENRNTDIEEKKVINEQLETIVQRDNSIIINPKFPPDGYSACKMDGLTDDTQAFQKLIDDFVNIKLPSGILRYTSLELSGNTNISGLGVNQTYLKPLPTSIENSITLKKGANVGLNIVNLTIEGIKENEVQNGVYLKAIASDSEPFHGGLWLSTFKNINIKNFSKTQLVLHSGSNALLPHQGLTFERLECNADNIPTSKALSILGQAEQITWNQCAFSGTKANNTLVELKRESGGDIGGGSQTFLQCYFGNGVQGIYLERSCYIKFLGCYFENLELGSSSQASCEGVTFESGNYQLVTKCHMGNDSSSEVLFSNNKLIGCNILIDGWGCFTECNSFGCNTITNEKRDNNIDANILNVSSKYTRVGNTSDIITLNNHTKNNELVLSAWASGGFKLKNTGNIDIRADLQVNQFETVVLVKISSKWLVINKFLY